MNPGKTYIGWVSSNYGGYCSVTAGEPEPEKDNFYNWNVNHFLAFK